MRIIYADYKANIEEPKQNFPTLVTAIAALDELFQRGSAMFGQVLDMDGRVLENRAPNPSKAGASSSQ